MSANLSSSQSADRHFAGEATWHVFDVRAIWIREFVSELARSVPAVAWRPRSVWLPPALKPGSGEVATEEFGANVISFPIQRGFSHPFIQALFRTGQTLASRAARRARYVKSTPLLCTMPHYAPLAEHWPGPVIYYVTDLFKAYGEPPGRIVGYERRMCRRARLVCPNSSRIADYLVSETGCDPKKIEIVPNATRESNVASHPIIEPQSLPHECAHLKRPIAGVIGNMAANIDWVLLEKAVDRTGWLTWLFIGPYSMAVPDTSQRQARQRLLNYGGRVVFAGERPYQSLAGYARAIDVAILPYLKREPTYSGSSTRFYEHLAACRPMLATRAFHEIEAKKDVLQYIDTAEQLDALLLELSAREFTDGREQARWQASRYETWNARARTLLSAFRHRVN
jgi:hypothetical protein